MLLFEILREFRASLSDLNAVSIIARLLLSVACGGIIGIDRARKRRPAGLRTYMLVCLGSSLVMITNQYITMLYPGSDPARFGAQVISGIGFLGAGTIIVTRHHQVIGLTTAAGLWASACMGLALGIGFYEGALFSCALIAIIISVIHRFDNLTSTKSRVMEIFVEFGETGSLSEFIRFLSNNGIKVTYLELAKETDGGPNQLAAIFTLRLPHRHDHIEVLQRLSKIDGVKFVEEV